MADFLNFIATVFSRHILVCCLYQKSKNSEKARNPGDEVASKRYRNKSKNLDMINFENFLGKKPSASCSIFSE